MKSRKPKFNKRYGFLVVFILAIFVIIILSSIIKGAKPQVGTEYAASESGISVGVTQGIKPINPSEDTAAQHVEVNNVSFGKISLGGGQYASKNAFSTADLLYFSNQKRISEGLSKLASSQKLSQSAQLKCEDMVKNDYWSHNAPNGSEPWVFFEKVGYKYKIAGENLAYGYTSSQSTVSGWMESPTHRRNLLDEEYAEVGFGVCEASDYINKGYYVIVVQHLGFPG